MAALDIDPAKCAALEANLATAHDEARTGGLVVQGDATSWDDMQRATDTAAAAFGGIDVLVNCVGLFDFYLGIGDLTRDQIDGGFGRSVSP